MKANDFIKNMLKLHNKIWVEVTPRETPCYLCGGSINGEPSDYFDGQADRPLCDSCIASQSRVNEVTKKMFHEKLWNILYNNTERNGALEHWVYEAVKHYTDPVSVDLALQVLEEWNHWEQLTSADFGEAYKYMLRNASRYREDQIANMLKIAKSSRSLAALNISLHAIDNGWFFKTQPQSQRLQRLLAEVYIALSSI